MRLSIPRVSPLKVLASLMLAAFCVLLGLSIPILPPGFILRGISILFLLLILLSAWQVRSPSFGLPPKFFARMLLVTVGLSILWPRYIFFPVGGAYLNPEAIAVLLALAACSVVLVANVSILKSESMSALGLWGVGWMILVWLLWRVFCSLVGEYPAASIFSLFKEMAYSTSFIVLTLVLLSYPGADKWLLRVIVLCGLVTVVFGLVEAIVQKNPLIKFAAGAESEAVADALRSLAADKIREGAYRAQSFFTHPIVFAQFVAALMPLALLLAMTEQGSFKWRALGVIVIPIGLLAIMKSGSRAGLVSVLASVGFGMFVFWLRTVHSRGIYRILALLAVPVLLLAVAVVGAAIQSLTVGRSSLEAGSTSARVEMFWQGVRALQAHPIFGYGEGMSVGIAGLTDSKGHTSVDSYLLSIAIDNGYPGLVLFVLIIFVVVFRLALLAARNPGKDGLSAGMVATSVMALFVSFVGLSIAHNMTLLWVLLVLGLVYGKRLSGAAGPRTA